MKKILYLGIDPPTHQNGESYIHYPIIQVIPRDRNSPEIQQAFKGMSHYTHLLFTSKNGVRIFMEHHLGLGGRLEEILDKSIVAVGKQTAEVVRYFGMKAAMVAQEETAEGITHLLGGLALTHPYFFWPHSVLSRSVIPDFFKKAGYRYAACAIYNTIPFKPRENPPFAEIEEIVFTSPSTVDAFAQFFGSPPPHVAVIGIGPVTQQAINSRWQQFS